MVKKQLRILQIGAGSMGTRRLRDLSRRSDVTLAVWDGREDRRKRAKESFSIPAFDSLDAALEWQPEAIVISTPPDRHDEYIELALDNGLHHFCEEHIWTYDYRRVEDESRKQALVSASSCSFHFLLLVKELKRIIDNELGDLHVYQMFLSTYMPSWHPGEGKEFYARHRHTAAAREMVPFELLWLNYVFAPAGQVAGSVSRRGQLDNDSEDTWCLQMDLAGGGHGQLTVLMGSPTEVRRGRCVGTNGGVDFDLMSGQIRLVRQKGEPKIINCGPAKDVIEAAYDDEINTFVETVFGQAQWPHSYRDSAVATATLAAAEKSDVTGRWEKIDPEIQPAHVPDEAGDL